jgi:hypothetical protein
VFDPDEVVAEPVEPAEPEATPLDGRGLAAVMDEAWKRLEARSRGEERCLPVPWPALAEIYDAHEPRAVLRPGVHVLVGGTGSGKTQLALALALEAAHDGHPVSYVGLELDTPGIGARLAALEWARIRRRKGTGPQEVERWSVLDWPRTDGGRDALRRVRDEVAGELDKLDGMRVSFAGARQGFSADDFGRLCHAVRERSSRERPGLVVLDFLQLLGPGELADGRINPDDREIRTRIARAAYVASDAARDGRLAVLLVSATARENYPKLRFDVGERTPADALVGLGKESGEIEYSATSVMVIARPGEDPGGMGGLRLVGVAKNRHGRTDWAWLGWNGSDFHDAPDERVELAVEAAKAAEAKAASDAGSALARSGKPRPGGPVKGMG